MALLVPRVSPRFAEADRIADRTRRRRLRRVVRHECWPLASPGRRLRRKVVLAARPRLESDDPPGLGRSSVDSGPRLGPRPGWQISSPDLAGPTQSERGRPASRPRRRDPTTLAVRAASGPDGRPLGNPRDARRPPRARGRRPGPSRCLGRRPAMDPIPLLDGPGPIHDRPEAVRRVRRAGAPQRGGSIGLPLAGGPAPAVYDPPFDGDPAGRRAPPVCHPDGRADDPGADRGRGGLAAARLRGGDDGGRSDRRPGRGGRPGAPPSTFGRRSPG